MVKRYSTEMIDYIREITPGRYTKEITEMFNEKFGLNLTTGQMKSLKNNRGIWSGVKKKNPNQPANKIFSREQEQFIRDRYFGIDNQELTDLLNERFNTQFTRGQVKAWKNRNKLDSGLNGYFEPGHVPINKGTKGMFNVGGNSGSFRKGDKPKNFKAIGTERIDRDGYILVKMQDEGAWNERWRHKHKIIWEKENGLVPNGMVLIFIDQDKTNISLENLMLITNQQHLMLNRNGWRFDDPELQKIGINLADLKIAAAKRKQKVKDSGGSDKQVEK